MRRLPIYLVFDTSGSMNGEAIAAVNTGMQTLVSALRQDPYALETAYLCVIGFDTDARVISPLTEVAMFQPPALKASGLTSLGAALALLAERIAADVVKNTPSQKGDWKPLVFLMTDGEPTDDWRPGLARLKEVPTGVVVACAAGPHASTEVLQQITEAVVRLDTADSSTFNAFFKWVSAASIQTSKRVDLTKQDVSTLDELPPPPPEVNVVGV
ncbi:vWA domain-containing protein [Thiococcus pfennigii]|uniref:vWA domain-containing protein n=1 Tax=Thiococcus pfennigii TaxID=1057 RepID=UPI00190474D8|nr:VWA domain-containing protein [Thiococcus pfennigii]MBK1700867.1 tellurium resistance protein TerY [Thiococcus pfennigii]